MRKFITYLACAAALAVSACNTVEGVGEDMQAAGQGVTTTAQDAQR